MLEFSEDELDPITLWRILGPSVGTFMTAAYSQCTVARKLGYIGQTLVRVAEVGLVTISPLALKVDRPIDMWALQNAMSRREERRIVRRGIHV